MATSPHVVETLDGQPITLPIELVEALARFMTGKKPAGSIEVQFKNGGVAGVEIRERVK